MAKKNSKLLHTYSAGLLIFIDNVFWRANALTLGLSTPIICVLAKSTHSIGKKKKLDMKQED